MYDIWSNRKYFDNLVDTLSRGIRDDKKESFVSLCEEVIPYAHMFSEDFFYIERDDTNENTIKLIDLILPSVRRAYSLFFDQIPTIFINTHSSDKRLDLYQSQFDIKEFLTHLKFKLMKNIHCLDDFENIDKYSELLSIIVSDYSSSKVKTTLEFNGSFQKEVRNLRMKKLGM